MCGFAKKTIAASGWSHHNLPDVNIFYCRDELVTQVGDLVTEVGDLVTQVAICGPLVFLGRLCRRFGDRSGPLGLSASSTRPYNQANWSACRSHQTCSTPETQLHGDRQTGKTTVAVDAILNQTDVLCVYVAIGQKTSTVAEMISGLARTKDMSSVVIVLSGADEASTLQFLAPYTGGPKDMKNQLLERFNDRCALTSTTLGSLSDLDGNPRPVHRGSRPA